MRALTVVGLLVEHEDGQFSLTAAGALLRTGVPGSQRSAAIANGEENWAAWGALLHSVRTGETAFVHAHGTGLWEYYSRDPESSEHFNRRMLTRVASEARLLLAAYDFSSIRTLVDVGGGHGGFTAAILQAYPDMRGILFDQPHVVAGAEPYLVAAGVKERCETVGGDFFEAVPDGGDAYFLSRIIHGFDDDNARRILRNCRRVLPTTGKLLVWEVILPERAVAQPGPPLGPDPILWDLGMMVLAGGRERTGAEFRTLFAEAGVRLTGVTLTTAPDGLGVIEGVRV
jgi:SAM-dependent methyltransferase